MTPPSCCSVLCLYCAVIGIAIELRGTICQALALEGDLLPPPRTASHHIAPPPLRRPPPSPPTPPRRRYFTIPIPPSIITRSLAVLLQWCIPFATAALDPHGSLLEPAHHTNSALFSVFALAFQAKPPSATLYSLQIPLGGSRTLLEPTDRHCRRGWALHTGGYSWKTEAVAAVSEYDFATGDRLLDSSPIFPRPSSIQRRHLNDDHSVGSILERKAAV